MDYIEIAGYKSIKNERIQLKPINILIGANGSGKSNFISFFDFLNRLYHRKINEYIALSGGPNKLLYKGQKITEKIVFKIEFDGGKNGYAAILTLGAESFIFSEERLIYKSDWGEDISRAYREAIIKLTDNYRAKYVIRYLNGFRKYHFHDTSKNSPFTELSHIDNDSFYLYGNGANIAAFLYETNRNHKIVYNRIVKTIQSIAPYFSDFFFHPNKENLLRRINLVM